MLPETMNSDFSEPEATLDLCRLPPMIGPEIAGALLGCSPEQLTVEINTGLIPAVKIGRGWRFVTGQLIECMTIRAESARKERFDKHTERANTASNARGALSIPTTPRRRGRPRKGGPGDA